MPPRALDDRIAELREQPDRTWGVRDALLGVVAVPLSIAVLGVLLAVGVELPPVAATVGATGVLAGLAVFAGRRAARQSGGWSAALGLDLPEWRDVGRVLLWSVGLLLVQSAVTVLLQSLVEPLEGAVADNASFLADEPLGTLVVFALLAVAVAPVLEELLFRGLVLRGFMLRTGFWPAAVLSSVLFGLFHAQGADASSALVVVATAVFGLGLCLLVRRTGRLGPAIGVHALRNAVAVVAVTSL